jgi:hypothetical protein
MAESSWALAFLGLMSLSLLIMTLALAMTAADIRKTLARINDLLPVCDQTFQETNRTLAEFRELLSRTNRSASHLESASHRLSQTILGTIEQWMAWKRRVQALFTSRMSNGAGAEPRHQKRSSWTKRRGLE